MISNCARHSASKCSRCRSSWGSTLFFLRCAHPILTVSAQKKMTQVRSCNKHVKNLRKHNSWRAPAALPDVASTVLVFPAMASPRGSACVSQERRDLPELQESPFRPHTREVEFCMAWPQPSTHLCPLCWCSNRLPVTAVFLLDNQPL